ncbi:MAG TPA: hypothetical protein VIR59_11425 [Gaiellaceae bacterium]
MTIELKTPAAAHALADYLERCGCTVVFASEQTLDVKVPAREHRDALIELQAYVRVWSAMYPDHEVNVSEEA